LTLATTRPAITADTTESTTTPPEESVIVPLTAIVPDPSWPAEASEEPHTAAHTTTLAINRRMGGL
jgi:hypothetical protein